MNEIKLGNKFVGSNHKPFIIAELSGNHNQSLERALELVRVAAAKGADAVKLQTYTADTMTLDINRGPFKIEDEENLWKGEKLYDLYKKAYTPWEWHKEIRDLCRELKVEFFSSPFDESAVDFLESLDVDFYKVASFENTDLPLLKKVAETGKPVIMSTGMASIAELGESVDHLRKHGCKNLILLKCTSTYPASPENTNITTIPHMSKMFDCLVGLSDHTMGIGVSTASVALGAPIIEKHFTLSRADGGVDSQFSLEPQELESLCIETERAWQSLGKVKYGVSGIEKQSLTYRRSIYISKDVKKGDVLSLENVKRVRPAEGLKPKHWENVLGKKFNNDFKAGDALNWDMLD